MVKGNYQAVVEKIILDGLHGPYAVARSSELGLITFPVKENDYPEPGIWVVLTEIRKKSAGWRAQTWRFLEPSDEKQ